MQEIRSSNPPVVTGICDPNKSRARHHRTYVFFFFVLDIIYKNNKIVSAIIVIETNTYTHTHTYTK